HHLLAKDRYHRHCDPSSDKKICAHCLKEQRLEKKLKRFDEKREDWVSGRKKNHNIASIKDEAIVLLEKLHAIGLKPVLLLGKETRKKERQCEILTPRCTLPAYAQDYLDKIGTFYEYLCEGWTQDSTGQGVAEDPDEERVTLNLTPCDPSEPTNNWQEAGTTESQVPETSTVQVLKDPPVKQCTTKEVGQEAGTTESQVPETSTVQCTITEVGQEAGTKESQVAETSTMQVECTTKEVGQEAGTTESQVPETSTVQVLKAPPREAVHHHRGGAGGRDQREPGAGDKHRAGGGAEGPPLKQCTTKEVGQEAGTTESQVPETSTVQVEVLRPPPREAVHHHRGGAGGAAPAG
ncbi:hypothetical protein NQZ68_033876, partial [Dissostichus eleginoides]